MVKTAIGTASNGVRFVQTAAQLAGLADELEGAGLLAGGGVVVQQAVEGPLAMVQTVFSDGDLVAFHANVRIRAGHSGGAAVTESSDLAGLHAPLANLGRALDWHGALSCDAIIGPDGRRGADTVARRLEGAIPVVAATLATLVRPDAHRLLGGSAVSGYALTAQAWATIVAGT